MALRLVLLNLYNLEHTKMKYLDKYPSCKGCPVSSFCGTMVSSSRLCNSYENKEEQKDIEDEILSEIGVVDPYDCC